MRRRVSLPANSRAFRIATAAWATRLSSSSVSSSSRSNGVARVSESTPRIWSWKRIGTAYALCKSRARNHSRCPTGESGAWMSGTCSGLRWSATQPIPCSPNAIGLGSKPLPRRLSEKARTVTVLVSASATHTDTDGTAMISLAALAIAVSASS